MQSTASDELRVVDFTLNEAAVLELRDELGLTQEETAALRTLVEAYRSEVRAIDRGAYQAMLDAGAQRIVDAEARSSARGHTTREDLETRAAIYQELAPALDLIQRQALAASDEALLRCVSAMREAASLDDAAVVTFQRIVRRMYFFQTDETHRVGDFRARISLTDLVVEAQQPGGELQAVVVADSQDELHVAREALDGILSMYEARLQNLIESTVAAKRRPSPLGVVRFSTVNDPLWRQVSDEAARRWKRQSDVLMVPHRQIADILLRYVGPDAKQRWEDRLYRKLCPDLTRECWIDRLDQWVHRNAAATSKEQLAIIAAIVVDYRRARQTAVRSAVESGIQAHGVALSGVGENGLCVNFSRDLMRLRELGVNTLLDVGERLGDADRAKLADVVRRQGLDAVTGASIPGPQLAATGFSDQYAELADRFDRRLPRYVNKKEHGE